MTEKLPLFRAKPRKEKNTIQEQHVKIPFTFYRNKELYDKLQQCLPVYTYLISCIYRKEHGNDKLDIYNNYYKMGYLAAAVTQKELARLHHHSETTISDYLKLLEQYKIIRIDKIDGKYTYNKRTRNIYVLGKVWVNPETFKIVNHYFIQDV